MSARDDAADAARAAGVGIRLASTVDDTASIEELFTGIWGGAEPVVPRDVLLALAHAGNYVSAAYDDKRLVGACMGFLATPGRLSLHSHIAGVVPGMRGRHVGLALKLHQRAWALEAGLAEITWTFDPLIRRNAWFNLFRLGARPREYLVDFYGDLGDGVNQGQGSDRLLVAWQLADDFPPAATEPSADALLVPTPPDIEALRLADPAQGLAWRREVRENLGGPMAEGAKVVGFTVDGCYIVERTPA